MDEVLTRDCDMVVRPPFCFVLSGLVFVLSRDPGRRSRLRRSALPWADMCMPLWGESFPCRVGRVVVVVRSPGRRCSSHCVKRYRCIGNVMVLMWLSLSRQEVDYGGKNGIHQDFPRFVAKGGHAMRFDGSGTRFPQSTATTCGSLPSITATSRNASENRDVIGSPTNSLVKRGASTPRMQNTRIERLLSVP